jgi:hypothetical protein
LGVLYHPLFDLGRWIHDVTQPPGHPS